MRRRLLALAAAIVLAAGLVALGMQEASANMVPFGDNGVHATSPASHCQAASAKPDGCFGTATLTGGASSLAGQPALPDQDIRGGDYAVLAGGEPALPDQTGTLVLVGLWHADGTNVSASVRNNYEPTGED
jgi:hypothetical protein